MATSEKIVKEGIVIRLSQTKEADAMVNALGPDGLFSFYARGIGKLTSKNRASVQALSHASFALSVSSSGSATLTESKPIESFLPKEQKLEQFAILSFLEEISAKIIQPGEGGELYPWLHDCLKAIKEGFDPLTIGLIYFAHLMVDFGIGLDVDECVVCHKKTAINALSYEEGGFLCNDHCHGESAVMASPRKLKILRYLFRVPLTSLTRIAFERGETIPLYAELGLYLHQLTGTNLKSLSVIEKLS